MLTRTFIIKTHIPEENKTEIPTLDYLPHENDCLKIVGPEYEEYVYDVQKVMHFVYPEQKVHHIYLYVKPHVRKLA